MSKLDAQRAMREAKYARNQAAAQDRGRTAPARSRATPPVAPPVSQTDAPTDEAGAAPPDSAGQAPATEALCGHRSMNGRTCTRPAGHPQKNHRYS